MPFFLLAIPAAEVVGWGLVALRTAILANRARILIQGAQAAGAVATAAAAHQATKDNAAPATGTTTVVGNKTLNCGEDGSYGEMQKKTGNNKFDRDHVPSKGALQKAARDLIDKARITLTKAQEAALFGDNGAISKAGQTIIIPKKDHAAHSDTYGGRNKPEKIKTDADDLQKAAEKDTKAIEDGDSKEMDAECLEKYKKAAEKIKKKTHAEYLNDLKKLIKDAIKNN